MKNRFKIWFAFVALMIGFVGAFPVSGQIQTLEDGSTIFPIHGGRNLVQLDPWGRLEGVLNSRGGLTTFSYNDPAGNIAWRQNGEGELTEYGYDTMNRLVAVTNESVEVAVYDHDNNGNVVLSENGNASVATGYDSLNRLSSSTQTVGSVDFVVNNTFDLNGNRTGITYPGGLSVSYNYGADNRLDGITTTYGGNNKNITFGYDTANRLTGVTYPNGVNSTYGYDAESRVTSIQHGSFVDRTIHRNELGFKTTEVVDAGTKPTVPGTARRIKSHNDADQLVSEQVQQGTNWTDIVYSYTDNGGLASVQSAESVDYTYDYDNRLESATSAQSAVQYLHDASGARIGRIDGTTVAYFVVDYADGLKRPLAETDDQGNITRFYIWSGAHLICHIEANGDTYYYHSDELGSTLALTDSSGTVTDEFAYMPYGYAVYYRTDPSTGQRSLFDIRYSPTPFQWLGGYGVYYDADTDLHLTLHRAYSSKLKRFISPDPLGIDGGVNVYAMANLNPLYFVDPYGLSGLESVWGDIGDSLHGFGDAFVEGIVGLRDVTIYDTLAGVGNFLKGAWNGDISPYDVFYTPTVNYASDFKAAYDEGDFYTTGNMIGGATFNVELGLVTAKAGQVVGRSFKGAASTLDDFATKTGNPVPSNYEFARVLKPGQIADIQAGKNPFLSTFSGADDAFITTSKSIPSGLTQGQAAEFLTIPQKNVGGVIRFQVPNGTGVATPINRNIPGFINGGRTAGGLPEFVIPNQPVNNFNFTLETFQ